MAEKPPAQTEGLHQTVRQNRSSSDLRSSEACDTASEKNGLEGQQKAGIHSAA